MLADYYLSQKGTVVESNKIFRDLTKVFEDKHKDRPREDYDQDGLLNEMML